MAFLLRYTGTLLLTFFVIFYFSCNEHPVEKKKVPAVTDSLRKLMVTYLPDSVSSYKKIIQQYDSFQLQQQAGNWSKWIKTGNELYNSVRDLQESKDSVIADQMPFIGNCIFDSIELHEKAMPDDSVFNITLCKLYSLEAYYSATQNNKLREKNLLEKFITNPFSKQLSANGYIYPAYHEAAQLFTMFGENKKALNYFLINKKLISDSSLGSDKNMENTAATCNTLRNEGSFDEAIGLLMPFTDSIKYVSPETASFMLGVLAENWNEKGNKEKAKTYFDQSIKILIAAGSQINTNMLRQLTAVDGDISFDNNQFKEALAKYNKALQMYDDSSGREVAKIMISKGDCYAELGMNDSAMNQYQLALRACIKSFDGEHSVYANPVSSDFYSENAIVDALEHKADLLKKMGSPSGDTLKLKAAVDCYELSLRALEKLLEPFTYDDSRISALEQAKTITEDALLTCNTLLKKTGNAVWGARAFHFTEQTKATVLLESLKKQVTVNGESDSLFQQLDSLQKISANLETSDPLFLHYDSASIAETKTHDSLLQIYNTLQSKLLNIETILKNNNSQYAAIFSRNDSITIDMVQQKLLTDQNMLVDYFYGDSAQFIFIARKGKPLQFLQLDSMLVNKLDSFFLFFADKDRIAGNPAGYAAAAYQLFTLLKLDLLPSSIHELILIPDGKLGTLPFEALLTSATSSQNMQQWPYLLKAHQTSYGYSVATLLQQAGASQGKTTVAMAAFAPLFEGNHAKLSPLTNTAGEIKTIEENLGEGVYFNAGNATLENFRVIASKAGILHLATHAFTDTVGTGEQPRIAFSDSSLYLSQLYAMKLNASLVVLSACQTGIGRIAKTEGPMSLARGCYYAGARNVISSLWEVDDKSTGELFGRFYKNLDKHNYARSLQQAQIAFIENASSTKASPFYWASFIHIGYQPHPVSGPLPWVLGIAALLIFSALLYLKKKRSVRRTS